MDKSPIKLFNPGPEEPSAGDSTAEGKFVNLHMSLVISLISIDEIPPSYDYSVVERSARFQEEWIKHHPKYCKKRHWSTTAPTIDIHFKVKLDEPKGTFSSWLFGRGRNKGPEWRAVMRISTWNIPRLMARGLYWGPHDVQEVPGGVHLGSRLGAFRFGYGVHWNHTRIYHIEPPGKLREWTAQLFVFAKTHSTLAQFDINCLTPETVESMKARNWKGDIVYLASRERPDLNFNTLYGLMPLKGWWMWPKTESMANEQVTESLPLGDSVTLEDEPVKPGPMGIVETFLYLPRRKSPFVTQTGEKST